MALMAFGLRVLLLTSDNRGGRCLDVVVIWRREQVAEG
jgi:hypothetical protein